MDNCAEETIKLSELVDVKNPQMMLNEVKITILMAIPEFNFIPLDRIFFDIVRLFRGEYQGYKKCNTEYHDLNHTLHTFLAIARLVHGSFIHNNKISGENVLLGLFSALLHDAGYIQTVDDHLGTGAKYTHEHIVRSLLFMEKYFVHNNYSLSDFNFCKNCISLTGGNIQVNTINFSSHEEETVAKMLGTADLLSQMADRNYLEKLLFLYYEFREGSVLGCDSEVDLLKKTLNLYASVVTRLADEFGNYAVYMSDHFKARWNI
ncbi:MAG: hypothetical protein JXB48_00760, partial [Candidatus Latescibacteria bacterium]|nr:hypothetical protein [Candidatus Latescibacterota bacterium]